MTVRPYPWNTLERVPKRAVQRLREVRAHAASFVPEGVAGVLSTLVGARVEVSLASLGVGAPERRLVEVTLVTAGAQITIGAEVALVTALLERVLARPFALARPEAALDASLTGAFAALVIEVARRVVSEPVTLAVTPARPLAAAANAPQVAHEASGEPLCARVNVHVDDRVFAAYALATLPPRPTRAPEPKLDLDTLGELLLGVPLVVAVSLATRDELRRLTPGTAFMPGEPAWVDVKGAGRGVLIAATGERGVWVELPPDGRLVLRGQSAELSQDSAQAGATMSERDDVNETLTDAVLEAPVVVRVELGAVSMSASDWARVRTGDVLETGRRVAEPVLLRVAGRVVARGELVDVDGEVGVRVRELVGEPSER